MLRSSSSSRVSDEFYKHSPLSSLPAQSLKPNPDVDELELPTYDPQSDAAKKERARLRSAEATVHLIPFLLVLCAIILWYFSNPVDMVNKG